MDVLGGAPGQGGPQDYLQRQQRLAGNIGAIGMMQGIGGMAGGMYGAADQGGGVFAQARILSGIQRGQGDTAYNIERNRLGGQQEHETTAAQERYTKLLRTIVDISEELEQRISKLQVDLGAANP
jgi:hypothetical protein